MATVTETTKEAPATKEASRCRKYIPNVVRPTEQELAGLGQEDAELLLRAIGEPMEYIDHAMFHVRGAEKKLFGEDLEDLGRNIGQFVPMPAFVADPDLESAGPVSMATLTTQQEQLLFQRYNFARWRVYAALKERKGKKLLPEQMRSLATWLKIASASRAQIVQANMPLVLAMAKRTKLIHIDFAEIISEGNMALLRSVEKFDCSRGFKFSTYACRAILKAFSRVAIRSSRYHSRFPVEFDPAMEKSDFLEQRRQEAEATCVAELRSILTGNLADLSDVEKKVIRARFALDAADPGQARPMTLEEVGGIIGVTKERVRQIQNKALEKLRQRLEENILTA
jgi:RNA polymerase sigma factor (sigma-70 family)